MKKSTKFFVIGGLICLLTGLAIMLITGLAGGVGMMQEIATNYKFGRVRLVSYGETAEIEDGDFARFSGMKEISVSENQITSVKIVADEGEIEILQGNGDCIGISAGSYGVDYAVSDGRLVIRNESDWIFDGEEIIVYLPRDMTFELVELSVGGGEIDADYLDADQISVKVGGGEVSIERLNAKELDANVGAGEISVERGYVEGDVMIDVGVGEASFGGFAGGSASLQCGMGELSFYGENMEQTAYNYEMSCGAGEIRLNGSSYSGVGLHKRIDNGASRSVDIDCGMGEIEVSLSAF